MTTPPRRARSTGAAPTRLRAWPAVLVGGMVIAGCAQAQTTADSTTSIQPVSPIQSADASNLATAAHRDPATIAVDAQCPNEEYPFVSLLTAFKDWTTAVGRIVDPRAPEASKPVAESDVAPAMIYDEFDAVIGQVLAGPRLDHQISLSFQGGKTGKIVTEVGKESQSAWAKDGSFIGLFRPDTKAPTGWIADMLPVVDGGVVFPGDVGCFEPAGLQDVDERPVTVLVFDNGMVTELSGLFPTASLEEVTQKLSE